MSVRMMLPKELGLILYVVLEPLKRPAQFVTALNRVAKLSVANARQYNTEYPDMNQAPFTAREIFDGMCAVKQPVRHLDAYKAVCFLNYNMHETATDEELAILAEVEKVVGDAFLKRARRVV